MKAQVKERSVTCSAEEVRAILYGTKTQMRRIVKPQPPSQCDCVAHASGPSTYECAWTNGNVVRSEWFPRDKHGDGHWMKPPWGNVGDRLWVRETWAEWKLFGGREKNWKGEEHVWGNVVYRATHASMMPECEGFTPWLPSIHMPRWASRITLEITNVRVERLQDISEEDAKAEGAEWYGEADLRPDGELREGQSWAYRAGFQDYWQATYGVDAWDANPWVWRYGFKRVSDEVIA